MYNTLLRMSYLMVTCLLICFSSADASSLSALSYDSDNTISNCFVAPNMTCPPDLTITPGNGIDPDWTGYPEITIDSLGCPDPLLEFSDDIDTLDICHYRITRTWTATNAEDSSLFTQCIQTIETIDNNPPLIINCPQDVTVYTNTFDCESYINWDEPDYFDDSDLISIELTGSRNGVIFTASNEGYYPEGTTILTYRVEDECNNISFCQFELTVKCARCHLICPPDVCLETTADISPDQLGYAESYSGNTNCGDATIDYEDFIMERGCNGSMVIYRVWTAVFETMPDFDYTCTQLIELKDDTTVELFNCPPDITVDNNFIPVHWEQPQAVNGSFVVTLTSTHQPGSFFPVGITTVTYTAEDECGNSAQCSFTITVFNDMTYDDCPEDMEVACVANGEAYVQWDVPVYDGNCDKCRQGDRISGFVFIGSMNKKKYYCSTKKYKWEQAQSIATKYGSNLVTITSPEENDFLAKRIMAQSAFIGLNDKNNEGTFEWVSGEAVSYTNWFPGQPNNSRGNEDYVELMNTGFWNDADTDDSREVVIEIPCEFVKQIKGPKVNTHISPGNYTVLYHISDDCGLDKYCEFDIRINKGVSMQCPGDINIDLPSAEAGIIVNWDEPEVSTCCHKCDDDETANCIFLTQEAGDASGSFFTNGTSTTISYHAKDWCGDFSDCSFKVNIIKGPGSKPDNPNASMFSDSENLKNMSLDTRHQLLYDGVQLYPNPVSDILNIQDDSYQDRSHIRIYSTDGQLQKVFAEGHAQQHQLNLEQLDSGLYIIHLEYMDGRSEIKQVFVK